jgi:imidazolonepropionase-like amidohydrolase
MRLDLVLDSAYILGSLWGGLTGPQICPANLPVLPKGAHEAIRPPGLWAPAAVLAFVDVNVVPLDRERVLRSQTVLVERGRITALGPVAQVAVPAGAVRIDGRGQYLIPGFADMHNHKYNAATFDQRASGLVSDLASGVTAIRHTNAVSEEEAQKLRHSKMAEEQLSPRFYLAGDMGKFVRSGLRPDSAAAAYRAAGYDFILSAPDSLRAAARRLGLPLASHNHGASFEQMLALGLYGGSIDHLYSFYDTLGLREPKAAASVSELRALAAAAQRAGVWITPTLDCLESGYPSLNLQVLRQLIKALQDAGVGLLLGADGWYVQNELAALVRAGLTPYQALLTGTRNVAQYMGLLDRAGTVAVGKWADLVLLSGNPLQDIRHTREPAGVMRAGRWLDRAALDRLLLASSESWFGLEVSRSGILRSLAIRSLAREQSTKLREHMKKFEALTDSLEVAKPKSSEYERVLRLLADELGAMHAILTPELQETFDPIARVWLREQARQGYRVAVPGVIWGP